MIFIALIWRRPLNYFIKTENLKEKINALNLQKNCMEKYYNQG
jgi:hypothetical protein